MSLRSKIALFVMGVFLFYVIVQFGIHQSMIFPSFLTLEKEEAIKDTKRVEKAISREIYHLDSTVHDWAAWDDTYAFVESIDSNYIKSNLVTPTFISNQLNLIYICDIEGRVIWGEIRDLETESMIHIDDFPEDYLPKTHQLLSYAIADESLSSAAVSGVFMTSKGPLIVSSRPILNSNNEGPIRGFFIMGRFLTASVANTIVDQTSVDFKIFPIQRDTISENLLNISTQLTDNSPYLIENHKDDGLRVYASYPDIEGKAALLIESRIPKKITVKGLTDIHIAMLSTFAAVFVALVVILLLMKRVVLKPIERLTRYAMEVRKTGDLTKRLSIKNHDEIGILTDEFDKMLIQLRDDIEKRKQAQKALRESEDKYRQLFEMESDAIFLIGKETGQIFEVNTAATQIYGYSREELLKMRNVDVSAEPEDTRRATKENRDNVPVRYHRKKDGTIFPVEITARHFKWNGKDVHVAAIRDITFRMEAEQERKQLQERLQRAEKMEAIGTLAGGVAHDLNNILVSLVGYPDLLLMNLQDDSPLKDSILTIKSSGLKAANIVEDLLTLTRRGVAVQNIIDLNQVVSDYMKSPEFNKLLSFHSNVKVTVHLENDPLHIVGSPVHLSKTIMNLVSNAAESMLDGGEITISTQNIHIDSPIRGYEEVTEGEYAMISVSDSGVGISPEDISRIFEPFYTKKTMGRSGTGLGMAVVWGTVKDHHGYIDIESEEGNGTTFTLYFPLSQDEIQDGRPAFSVQNIMGKGESILVVDDVEEQRQIASKILEVLGYSVETVPGGEEAVEYLKGKSVDLLVLDMIMAPGMDGLDTYMDIIEINPKQKAIIVSGYSADGRVKKAQELGAGQYVKKPYTLETLGTALRKELDS